MTNQQLCQAFWQARRTVILSTQSSVDEVSDGVSESAQAEMETSVTPFIRDKEGNLYIFISELAQHTQNLLSLMAKRPEGLVSGLLLADESETEQLFARERLTLQLAPKEIGREEAGFADLLTQFKAEFGEVIDLLSSLPDFHLIQLKPIKGGYVRGFGQAFTFEGCPCHGLTPVTRK